MIRRPIPDRVVAAHRAAGPECEAGGVRSFVLDRAALETQSGEPVVSLHGVPSRSFRYRRLLPALTARGLRGIAFDFPGTRLAERPGDFDVTWSGPARWTGGAIDALGLDRVHLVLHDTGGPTGIGCAAHPDRVLSLTVLNSPIRVPSLRCPWPMHPFSIRGVRKAALRLMRPPFWALLFRRVGLLRQTALTNAEIDDYLTLLRQEDGGAMFLRIMRGFELTAEKETLLVTALRDRSAPLRIVWGGDDTMFGPDRLAELIATGDPKAESVIHGRLFLPEDNADAIANLVAAALLRRARADR